MVKGRKQPVRPRPETGDALRARLAAGPVTLSWTGIANSPYVYNLALTSDHKVPNVLSFGRRRLGGGRGRQAAGGAATTILTVSSTASPGRSVGQDRRDTGPAAVR
ncbi:hypothetical protein [Micromonospora sp. U21]|uniref:hypothetical protein n=1 Tax=Micromonospora sp. U21 TaxID=2824899 RepID=UPI001B3954D2|nr:hypothetical protein [Micromonospora sp. U21]MBQ0903135.1 hypothetical protein [Micromonospora sp. U21]